MMLDLFLNNGWLIVAAVLVALFGVGRFSRLITWDAFPPAIAIREWWRNVTAKHSEWTKLFECFWCMTPWLMLGCIGWFALGLWVVWVAVAWWIFWGWLALAYAASMIVARDEPQDD